MGGVDLCDMLMSLYRIQPCSTKYYLHMLYYMHQSQCCKQVVTLLQTFFPKGCPSKKSLLQFQSSIAISLLMACKVQKMQRGTPSLTSPSKKKTKSHASPTPINSVRYDDTRHLPDFDDKKQRCRFCPTGYSFVKCIKCTVNFCFVKGKNCFKDLHTEQ